MSTITAYKLTKHATERIRQRLGIDSLEVALSWATEQISRAIDKYEKNNNTHYVTETHEVVTDDNRIVTVLPLNKVTSYANRLKSVVSKEITKSLTLKNRELRKVEIEIAEHTLNHLKALNPKTKAVISEKLTDAVDRKTEIMDEIYAINKAAEEYGIEAN